MVNQLFLLSVHLRLQRAQPSVQIMLSKSMRNLIIVFERILQQHLGRGILPLTILEVTNGSLAAGRP
jgi:hypothetical protein